MITQSRLKEVLSYSPSTGIFEWIISTRKTKPGQIAGWSDKAGYIYIRIDKKLYAAARLAFLYMTGAWPRNGFADHINMVTSDNRWKNLRDATKKINQENRRKASSNNKSGFLGVSPYKGRFIATINTSENGRRTRHTLGYFDDPALGHRAYVRAKRRLHKGCTI